METEIVSNADFITGALYEKLRKGHPEGQVIYHIKEVLENIDKWYKDDGDYEDLRIIALLYDTFKHKVNQNLPKSGENHHGPIARRFAERTRLAFHQDVLQVIEKHDDAYNAWSAGGRRGDWYQAKKNVQPISLTHC